MALAHQRIDAYLDSSEPTIHNFVPCDFELVDQTLGWLTQNHLLTGPNFCELGSGFGVTTLLASLHGMNAVGIEREPTLVTQANTLAVHFFPDSPFYCGSFIPEESMTSWSWHPKSNMSPPKKMTSTRRSGLRQRNLIYSSHSHGPAKLTSLNPFSKHRLQRGLPLDLRGPRGNEVSSKVRQLDFKGVPTILNPNC